MWRQVTSYGSGCAASALIALTLLLGAACAAFALPAEVVMSYDFAAPQLVPTEGGMVQVISSGLGNWGAPGSPALPYRTCQLAIPPGTMVNAITVTPSSWLPVTGSYLVGPAPRPVPLSRPQAAGPTARDETSYRATSWFPQQPWTPLSTQQWRGHNIVTLTLFPVRYLPATGALAWTPSMTVSVSLRLTSTAETTGATRLSLEEKDLAELSRQVDNPKDIRHWTAPLSLPTVAGAGLLAPLTAAEYVIIANPALDAGAGANTLQAFAAHKQSQGITTSIVHTDWIYGNYSGVRPDGGTDQATSIRNFIIDAYNTWGTRYVLLVGDADPITLGGETAGPFLPHRGLAVDLGFDTDLDIPADLYYGCLDGSFDGDADGIYGEPTDGIGGGEVDLLAEVHVGRLCADSLTEVSSFVAKQLSYEANTPPRDVLMVGEYLGFGGVADWGGNFKDEIKDGSSAHGYTTVGFLDAPAAPTYDVSTLYDRDDPSYDWPMAALIIEINEGLHAINHLGHADVDYVMKMENPDVDSFLTNTDYFIGYTQGCYDGAFDNRTAYGAGVYTTSDSISEHLSVGGHGAVSWISNSRYGWGVWESTDGPSQHFDREFWDAILGESILEIGAANDDSKWDQLGYIQLDPIGRWCAYELNLFGDPGLVSKIGVSSYGYIALDHPVYPLGGTVRITVVDSDLDVNPGALDQVSVPISSSTETTPELIVCTEVGLHTGIFSGEIALAADTPAADGQLQVTDGDTITVTYVDANDGRGGVNVSRTATATVDGQPPDFAGLQQADPGDNRVRLTWSAASDPSEPITYAIYRGDVPGSENFATPQATTQGTSYVDTSVSNGDTYYYVVRAVDAAGNEDANTLELGATPTAPTLVYSFPLDSNPGWTCQGGWQFGRPTGGGLYTYDPTSGHTGLNVFGYNLAGDYPDNMGAEYLTTAPINCAEFSDVKLTFWRWLSVEISDYDHAGIEASRDGVNWTVVWEHTGEWLCANSWVPQEVDLSEVAAYQPAVRIRWRMGPTDESCAFPGWNIDDIQIWGIPAIGRSGSVALNRDIYRPGVSAWVSVLDSDLNTNPFALDHVTVQVRSTTEATPEPVVCTEAGPNTGTFAGAIGLVTGSAAADGFLQVAHGDTITVTYVDANDGRGGINITCTDTAAVDAQPPGFAGLTSALPGDGFVLLAWEAASDSTPPVSYRVYRAGSSGGQDFGSPIAIAAGTQYRDTTTTNGGAYYYIVRAQDAAGNEDTNTVECRAVPTEPQASYRFPLDTDPGWTRQGGWAFGIPTGGGSSCHDPTSGYTGANVFGYNLSGDYPNYMSAEYLTTPALNCTGLASVSLRFWRRLGVESSTYDHATVDVSTNGTTWQTIWENPDSSLCDSDWTQCYYDLSAIADNQPAVWIRWRMGSTDSSTIYPGWNLDDIELWAVGEKPITFSDVSSTFWAYNEIYACVDAGIVRGYPDDTYHPEYTVTRDQMAVYVARALAGGDANVPDPGCTIMPFTDVACDHWARKYIQFCVGEEVVRGYPEGDYKPSVSVTRDQMAVYVARSLVDPACRADLSCYTPPGTADFDDVVAGHWAFAHVEYCYEHGIVHGYDDGLYHPERTVTRDQMAVYMARAFGLL